MRKTPSIKELREITKTNRRDPLYTLIDYLAYYPAKLFLYTSITANQVSVIWIIGQIIAALFLTTGNYLTMVIALVVFQLMFILDCTDGIMARYKKEFTLNGGYLDRIGHYIANPLLLICLGIGVTNSTGNLIYTIAGILAALFFLLNKALTQNPVWFGNPQQKEKIEAGYKKMLPKNQKGIIFFIFAFVRLEYIFNLMFFGVFFGYAHYIMIAYTIFFFIEVLRKMFVQLMYNYKLDHPEN